MILKPGVNLWGGSDEYRHGQQIPFKAIDKWEKEFGWKDQYHLIHFGLSTFDGFRPGADMRGFNLQLNLAKRITDGGGYVQALIWGTPQELASIPLDQVNYRGNPSYPQYPPKDFKLWAKLYIKIVQKILLSIPINRVNFNIWHEPNGWWWKASDNSFFRLYDTAQKAIKKYQIDSGLKISVGGYQQCDMADEQYGPDFPAYLQTKSLDYLNRFFSLAAKNKWQVDFFDSFMYHWDPELVVSKVMEIEDLMYQYGIEAESVFNCLSHAGWFGDGTPFIDPELEASYEYTMKLAKLLKQRTNVTKGGFDFLEDSGRKQYRNYKENGLLETVTLRERPRWRACQRILT